MNELMVKNKQIVGAVVGGLAVLLLFIALFIRPQFSKLGELAESRQQEQAKLEKAMLTLKRLRSVRAEAAVTEAELIGLSREVPDESEIPSLVVEIQQMAEASGLEFTGFGLEKIEEEEQDGYAKVPLKVTAKGNFYAVVDFMYRIERIPRKLVVTKFELKASDEYPTLELTVELNAFKKIPISALPGQPGVPGAAAPGASGPAAGNTGPASQ